MPVDERFMSTQSMAPGDFTGLANEYARYRPDYATSVLDALLQLNAKPAAEIDFVDVGAGTGIWTRMVYNRGVKSTIAVEPNDDMRIAGNATSAGLLIQWLPGSAECTGLADRSCDWLTMASSFHWADFERATSEFTRVLRPGGWFTALWNPRVIEESPLLMEIESHLQRLCPGLNRVSSGRSGITTTLSARLRESPLFDEFSYTEDRHVIEMSRERYLGAWRSVNDVRVQLGPQKFKAFLEYVETRTSDMPMVTATYLTRAWSVRCKGRA